MSTEVWASGTWIVKPGREEDFVAAWTAFAAWSAERHGPARAWLLRQRDRPGHFVSIGPWPTDDAIQAWRADPEFGARIAHVRSLVDAFEPATFDPVSSVGG